MGLGSPVAICQPQPDVWSALGIPGIAAKSPSCNKAWKAPKKVHFENDNIVPDPTSVPILCDSFLLPLVHDVRLCRVWWGSEIGPHHHPEMGAAERACNGADQPGTRWRRLQE